MTLPPPKVCKRIRKLHAQIGSSGKDADVAKQTGNPKIPELSRLDLRTACRNNYYFCLDFLEQV
jgi:hypothetical protein